MLMILVFETVQITVKSSTGWPVICCEKVGQK